MGLVLRTELGRRLTILEMDGNFVYLEDLALGISQSIATSGGIPSGGTMGHVLAKLSNDDYDVQWVLPTGGATGSNGSNGTSGTSGVSGIGIPTGGATGQILAKASSTNYEMTWIDKTIGSNLIHNGYSLEYIDFDLLDSSKLSVYEVDRDNESIEIQLPVEFGNFEFLGSEYSSIWINSNSYVTFGASSSESQIIAPGKVAAPAIFIGAGDNSLQYLSFGYEYDVDPGDMGDTIFRIRFEGSANQTGSLIGIVGIAWELHLDKSDRGNIKIVVAGLGANNPAFRNERNPGGVYGISDGDKWIDMYPSLPTIEETTGDLLNTVSIFTPNEDVLDKIKFVGPGVSSTISGSTSYVKIDPLNQFGIGVGYDNITSSPAASVISSTRYDLRLTTGENGSAIRLRPRGEAWIQPYPKNTNQIGNGHSVYVYGGGASKDASGSGAYNGGNVYIQGGAAAGGSTGSVYVGPTASPWVFGPSGDLTLPLGGDIKDTSGKTVLGIKGISYSEISSLIFTNRLVPGALYEISDFRTCYDQPDYNFDGGAIIGDNYRTSEIHPIIVRAISSDEISPEAYQSDYPNDRIRYDISWNETEVTGGTAYGRITERIDEFNNRTDYDHKNIKFKRYKTRFLNGTSTGTIISMSNGVVTGTNSSFFGDFATGSVIHIESEYPEFYKIINIESNTRMTVEGNSYKNFSDPVGFSYQYTAAIEKIETGCLYYFNDRGNNNIQDGGDDMYDGANYINTNLQNLIPYTHTQMTSMNSGTPATLGDFTYDGTVESGSASFGPSSSYFTNTYPGLFVMSAYDVDVDTFSITGGLGADGNGQVDSGKFTSGGYTIYTKRVWGTNDPSINHLIIVDTIDEGIVHDYDLTTEDDDDELSNLGNVTKIHYLLFSLSEGVKATDQQLQDVYESYLDTIDLLDINNTLSILNSSYASITDNLPENSVESISLGTRRPNIAEDALKYREFLTFDTEVFAINNYIGNSCDRWVQDGFSFMLPNNVFMNANSNSVDINDNIFGNKFRNNTFGDDVFRNRIGDNAFNNISPDRFFENRIGSLFSNNTFYSLEFRRNTIGDGFARNYMVGQDACFDNIIGNSFADNLFFSVSNLVGNRIGNSFNNNMVFDDLRQNVIGNDFGTNKIYRSFDENSIGNDFNGNNIYNSFVNNGVDNMFQSNTIGKSLSIGGSSFLKNRIGTDVTQNKFFGYTSNNTIGDNFEYNEIDYNFSYNETGSNFRNNTIANDFGFGGGVAQGNRIGNYFEDNTVGEYFYNNKISDVFNNNLTGDYFQSNDIQVQNLGGINFRQYYRAIEAFSDNSGLSPSIPGTTGLYSGLTVSGGSGHDATFNVLVSGATVSDVSLGDPGYQYNSGDILTIPYSSFGGNLGSNIEITVGTVSGTPSVYGPYSCTVFKNSANVSRISYYDGSDTFNIKDIDK